MGDSDHKGSTNKPYYEVGKDWDCCTDRLKASSKDEDEDVAKMHRAGGR